MPPRPGSASAGRATGNEIGLSARCNVACSVRTGTASISCWVTASRSIASPDVASIS